MKTFWVLMRKDRRLYRSAAIATVIFVAVPYLFVLPEISLGRGPEFGVTHAYPAGMMLLTVSAAMFGGLAFAGEKRNKAAEFLAILPASKLEIIASKLAVSGCYLLIAGAVHAVALFLLCIAEPGGIDHIFQFALVAVVSVIAPAGLLVFAFGLAWLLSVFLQSAAIAATCSLGVLWMLYCLVSLPWPSLRLFFGDDFMYSAYSRAIAVGLIGLMPGIASVIAGALIFRKQFSS